MNARTFTHGLISGLLLSASAAGAAAQDADAAEAPVSTSAAATATSSSAAGGDLVAYRVGKVLTMNEDDDVINNAVVLVKGSRIHAVGKEGEVQIPEGTPVTSFPDGWLVPGLIEAHNHVAGAMGDLHDYVWLTNPGLDTRETVTPNNDDVKRARAGGVTTALLIPGSGTNMSGFGTVVKLGGDSLDEVVVKSPGSIKIAQAGNPEGYWYRVGRSLMNYNTRHTLERALAYHEAWEAYEADPENTPEPAYDPTYDEFRGLFKGEFVASVHTQIYQVVMTTVDMLSKKLDVRTTLDHSTFDGFKVAPMVVAEGDIITMNGPRQFWFDGTQRKVFGNAARWWEGGVRKLGINTDSPVIPQEELSYQAAMACWYGWTPYEALKGLTAVAAESIMVEDRTGRIEPGLDADFAIWTGDPLDPRSACELTVINGEVEHDRDEKTRF